MKTDKFKMSANTGRLGEELATRYLEEKGFVITARNFRQKWGEIDIIAVFGGTTHFVEVKSVSCEIPSSSPAEISRITGRYMPEERVHEKKSKRLLRTIQSYLGDTGQDRDWSFDVAAVFLDHGNKRALVRFLEQAL